MHTNIKLLFAIIYNLQLSPVISHDDKFSFNTLTRIYCIRSVIFNSADSVVTIKKKAARIHIESPWIDY